MRCCHGRWCQRESGAAFALSARIESDRVERLSTESERVHTPSNRGMGQQIARCRHTKPVRHTPDLHGPLGAPRWADRS